MIYKIRVNRIDKDAHYIEADNQVDALTILVKELCSREFLKHPGADKVSAFRQADDLIIEPVTERILK